MSSLPFSVGSLTTPTKHHHDSIIRNFHTPESPVKFNDNISSSSSSSDYHVLELKKKSSESLNFRRREAIGIGINGLCLGFLDIFLSTAPAKAVATAPSTAPCEFTIAASGLAFCDKVVGYGPEVVEGQLIKTHYVGKLESGKVFDSSYNRGKPLTFRVGVGEVIEGWDQGILGGDGVPPMLAGGKRTLKIPSQLGYGMRGAGCKGGSCIIPPDPVLLFDVEFIGKA